jgi:hypothetical protein
MLLTLTDCGAGGGVVGSLRAACQRGAQGQCRRGGERTRITVRSPFVSSAGAGAATAAGSAGGANSSSTIASLLQLASPIGRRKLLSSTFERHAAFAVAQVAALSLAAAFWDQPGRRPSASRP